MGILEDNITGSVEVEEDMNLRRLLQRESMAEELNYGLDRTVMEVNNYWSKRDKVNGGEVRLVILYTYTQVENELEFRLTYLEAL